MFCIVFTNLTHQNDNVHAEVFDSLETFNARLFELQSEPHIKILSKSPAMHYKEDGKLTNLCQSMRFHGMQGSFIGDGDQKLYDFIENFEG
jgi:hypothetical protein